MSVNQTTFACNPKFYEHRQQWPHNFNEENNATLALTTTKATIKITLEPQWKKTIEISKQNDGNGKFTRNHLVMMRSLATTVTTMLGIFHLSVVVVFDSKNPLQMVTIIVTSRSDDRKTKFQWNLYALNILMRHSDHRFQLIRNSCYDFLFVSSPYGSAIFFSCTTKQWQDFECLFCLSRL